MSSPSKRCLICKPDHNTLYHHMDPDTQEPWIYCNKCGRGYNLYQYRNISDVSPEEFKQHMNGAVFNEVDPHEVRKMEFPRCFVTMDSKLAKPGVDYVRSRGLEPVDEMFFDIEEQGIVFPYYYENTFCGAQVRFLKPRVRQDGGEWKITTMPGTRLGNLVYGWNQGELPPTIKRIVVTEGAFNALSLKLALSAYGGASVNPFKCIATSGSGLSAHHAELLRDLVKKGYKVIAAPDPDEAGVKMFEKMIRNEACTHLALLDVPNKDWNDILIEEGPDGLRRKFLSSLKKI